MRKIYFLIAVFAGLCAFCSCEKDLLVDRNPDENDSTSVSAELIITKFDGGTVEWVSIQKGLDADAKVADAKQDRGDIVQQGDKLFVQLFEIENDTVHFSATGTYTVVLKHDKKDKMYIKLGVKFQNGLADVKWGNWLAW